MGKRSREKGHRGQREVAKYLSEGPFPDAQSTGSEQSRRRTSSRRPPDVEGTPFWIEVKYGKAPSIWKAMKQGAADTDGRPVLVVVKKDRTPPYVVMTLNDFVQVADGASWTLLDV